MAKVKIRITADGVFGADGQISIGEEFEVTKVPDGWKGRCMVLSKDNETENDGATKKAPDEATKKVNSK